MYLPAAFAGDEAAALYLIDAHPFATLIAGAEIAHIPLLLDRERRVLRGHVARANPLWRAFDRPVTAVFTGPHGYVSPRWYRTPDQVPTWNYAVAHVTGRATGIEGEAVDALLADLAARFEGPGGWTLGEVDPAELADMRRAIVAFEIGLDDVTAKLKLSQNRVDADREGAIAGLEAAGEAALVAWMRRAAGRG